MIYEIVYRIKGYTLADCMRPDPFWGKRIFRIDTDKLGTTDDAAIKDAAITTAPERYELHSIKLLPGSVSAPQPCPDTASGRAQRTNNGSGSDASS